MPALSHVFDCNYEYDYEYEHEQDVLPLLRLGARAVYNRRVNDEPIDNGRSRLLLKNLLALGIGLLIVFVTWRGFERLFHSLNERNDRRASFEGSYYTDYLRYDDVVGPKGAPNVRVRSIKKVDGNVIYDATYTTDEFGRRATYASPPAGREKFLAFFGCSYTFGEGLPDDETLPWKVAAMAPKYRVYNYGCSGYGPQQVLAKLDSGEFRREVTEPSGTLVYVFIPNHVRRAIGSMPVATKWGRTFPNYVFDADHNLVRNGDFTTGRPTLTRWYNFLADIDTFRYFGLDFPLFVTRRHLEFTAEIIRRAQSVSKEAFFGANFCVLLYPDSSQAEMSGKAIISYLKRLGVECLDLTALIDMRQERFTIRGDDHPSAAAHKAVAEALVEALRLAR
jgi:hypothetical protein